jgi:hypothetical protein
MQKKQLNTGTCGAENHERTGHVKQEKHRVKTAGEKRPNRILPDCSYSRKARCSHAD